MKIEIEVPDWADKQELYLHTYEFELVAIRRNYDYSFDKWDDSKNAKWYVKTSRCNKCGECCRHIAEGNPMYKDAIKGGDKIICPHLKDNLCSLGMHRPFSCVMDFHDDPKLKPKECTEEFKEV
jgi:hypothetical protein